ncbi:MAG: head GIN domain-containing protein [Ginsengibacter sp.]
MKNCILLLIVSIAFASCQTLTGNGNVHQEKRDIPNISEVNTSGSIDVEIKNGDSYSVVVEDDENLLPYVITEVNNGALNIHYKDGYSIMNDHAKVTVTAPTLEKLTSSGSADLTGKSVIKNSKGIEIKTSGSGDIDLNVDAPSISVSGSGSGDVTLSGMTKDFDCKMSGDGDVKCSNLKSENAVIDISGSSDVHVFASVSLKANVAGSGDVYYGGNPASPEIHIAGSGTVQQIKQ